VAFTPANHGEWVLKAGGASSVIDEVPVELPARILASIRPSLFWSSLRPERTAASSELRSVASPKGLRFVAGEWPATRRAIRSAMIRASSVLMRSISNCRFPIADWLLAWFSDLSSAESTEENKKFASNGAHQLAIGNRQLEIQESLLPVLFNQIDVINDSYNRRVNCRSWFSGSDSRSAPAFLND